MNLVAYVVIAFFALIGTASARVELPAKAVISYGNLASIEHTDGIKWNQNAYTEAQRIAAYRARIEDMHAMGVRVLFLGDKGGLNGATQVVRFSAFNRAAREFNAANPGSKVCIVPVYVSDAVGDGTTSGVLPVFDATDAGGVDSPLCSSGGKPVIGIWNNNTCINPLTVLAPRGPSFSIFATQYNTTDNYLSSSCKTTLTNSGGFEFKSFLYAAEKAEFATDAHMSAKKTAIEATGAQFVPGIGTAFAKACGDGGNKVSSNYELTDFKFWQQLVEGWRLSISKSPNYVVITHSGPGDLATGNYITTSLICDKNDIAVHNADSSGINHGFSCPNVPTDFKAALPSGFRDSFSLPMWTRPGFWRVSKLFANWFITGAEPAATDPFVAFAYRQHKWGLTGTWGVCPDATYIVSGNSVGGVFQGDNIALTSWLPEPTRVRVKIGSATLWDGTLPAKQLKLGAASSQTLVPFGNNVGAPVIEVLNTDGSIRTSKQGLLTITDTPKHFGNKTGRNPGIYADYVGVNSTVSEAGVSAGVLVKSGGTVKNNVIYSVNGDAIRTSGPADNVKITHNTISAAQTAGAELSSEVGAGGGSGFVFSNNIVANSKRAAKTTGYVGPDAVYKNNLFHNIEITGQPQTLTLRKTWQAQDWDYTSYKPANSAFTLAQVPWNASDMSPGDVFTTTALDAPNGFLRLRTVTGPLGLNSMMPKGSPSVTFGDHFDLRPNVRPLGDGVWSNAIQEMKISVGGTATADSTGGYARAIQIHGFRTAYTGSAWYTAGSVDGDTYDIQVRYKTSGSYPKFKPNQYPSDVWMERKQIGPHTWDIYRTNGGWATDLGMTFVITEDVDAISEVDMKAILDYTLADANARYGRNDTGIYVRGVQAWIEPRNDVMDLTTEGMVVKYNGVIYGTGSLTSADTFGGVGTINADPEFVSASNFSIQASSPARDAADKTFNPGTDRTGIARDSSPDIGAYEYINPANRSPCTASAVDPCEPGGASYPCSQLSKTLCGAAPNLSNPTNIVVPTTGGTFTLGENEDAYVTAPARITNTVNIIGGRKVHVKGLDILLAWDNVSALQNTRGLNLVGMDEAYVEGVLIDANDRCDGLTVAHGSDTMSYLNIDTKLTILNSYIANPNANRLNGACIGDCVQIQGEGRTGSVELEAQNLTCVTKAEGLTVADRQVGSGNTVRLSNVNVRHGIAGSPRYDIAPDGGIFYHFWSGSDDKSLPVVLNNAYSDWSKSNRNVSPGPATGLEQFIDFSDPNKIKFKNTNITGDLLRGIPPSGDFAPKSKVGINYDREEFCTEDEQQANKEVIDPDVVPFIQPARSILQASDKKVIAHWHQFPISRSKGGPDGDWYSSYAKVRLRPLPRPARTSSGNVEWKIEDALADIRQARQSGVDTFLINIYRTDMTNPWAWPVINYMLKAAARDNRGFTVAPNFDCSWGGDAAQGTAMANQYADFLASIGESSSDYLAKIGTSFLAGTYWAQNCQAAHWTSFKTRMAQRGYPTHLMCVFQGGGYRSEYDTACDSWSDWGERSADQALNLNWRTRYAGVSAEPIAGVISHGDTRYNEAETGHDWSTSEQRGFGTLRNTWGEVLSGGADWAHLVTWNDIGEHSQMYPNTAGQWAFYDLNAYYIAWFKTGIQPEINKDAIYYSHRVTAMPSGADMQLRHQPWANIIDVTAFLVSPATVEVITTSGTTTHNLLAGMQTFTVPLPSSGKPKFRMKRNGATVIDFESAFEIGSASNHDATYKAGGSLRAQIGATSCATKSPDDCLNAPGEPVWRVGTR